MKAVVQVLRKANTPKQMVMFPFGGGSGYSFAGLIGEIDKETEIIVINPPGHLFNKGKSLESIEAMAYLYSKELLPFLKDNCLLFGHSIGGIVAYELCKDLEKRMNFKRLIISSVNPPHCIMDDVDLHAQMDTPTLIKKCAALGGIPMVFKEEPELLEIFIAGLRADLKALEKYAPDERKHTGKLKTSASVLYSDKDYIVDASKLQEWTYYLDCSEFVTFSGDHFYLFDEANRKAVGKILTKHVNM